MILKDQLYTIVRQTETESSTVFSVVLNPECFIYKAHFPGKSHHSRCLHYSDRL